MILLICAEVFFFFFFFYSYADHRDLHSFPTRRSSDLSAARTDLPAKSIAVLPFESLSRDPDNAFFAEGVDRKSTRLNSSHGYISYAVFCLKKKKKKKEANTFSNIIDALHNSYNIKVTF